MGRKHKGDGQPKVQPPPDFDPITRSIALHGDLVAVAAGRRWRVVNARSGALVRDDSSHEGPVRGLAFAPDGRYLLTCADDKSARVWDVSDWSCVHHLKAAKKATCCTFSLDSRHVFFADRFGDVLCGATTPADGAAAAPAPVDASLLLGHLQSILTSLTCSTSSTGTPLIVSTDKEGKVRASALPADPTKGSYEIQSYCLGHTKFVTSTAAVPQPAAAAGDARRHLLVSGSGDGTVRLWDVDTGREVCRHVASEQPPPLSFLEQQQQLGGSGGGDGAAAGGGSDDGSEDGGAAGLAAAAAARGSGGDAADAAGEQQQQQQDQLTVGDASLKAHGIYVKGREACCAVLSVAVSPDGSTVALAVEGQQELQLLALDAGAGQLALLQKLALPGVANPAAVAFDATGQLWALGGVLLRETESAHVGVAARPAEGGAYEPVTPAVLSDSARAALELRVEAEEQQAAGAAGGGGYYHEGFKKAVYVAKEADIQEGKRMRREARDVERLRALAAARDAEKQQQQQQTAE